MLGGMMALQDTGWAVRGCCPRWSCASAAGGSCPSCCADAQMAHSYRPAACAAPLGLQACPPSLEHASPARGGGSSAPSDTRAATVRARQPCAPHRNRTCSHRFVGLARKKSSAAATAAGGTACCMRSWPSAPSCSTCRMTRGGQGVWGEGGGEGGANVSCGTCRMTKGGHWGPGGGGASVTCASWSNRRVPSNRPTTSGGGGGRRGGRGPMPGDGDGRQRSLLHRLHCCISSHTKLGQA